jgi:hypothetical protein
LARGEGTASLTLPGRPALAAETPLTLAGFAPELDGRWIVTQAQHSLDSGGLRTDAEAERVTES